MRSGFKLCNSCSDPTVFPVRILLETKALEQSSQNWVELTGQEKGPDPRQELQYIVLTPYGIYEKLQTKLIFDHFFVIPISEMWGKNVHSFYLRPKG